MLMLTLLTVENAYEILKDGGMHWILFDGSEFERTDFEIWHNVKLTEYDLKEIDRLMKEIDKDYALQVEYI